MNSRVIMRIDVLPKARKGLENVCESLGMTHVAVNSRVIEWLSKQPDMVQASVLGLLPAGTKCDVARLTFEDMASQRKRQKK